MSDSLPNFQNYVTISQAAKILGVSIDTLRRWDKNATLKSVRLDGKNRYYLKSDLKEFKKNKHLSISEAAAALSVSISTLRRLEERGVIIPERSLHGERLYSPAHVKDILEKRKKERKKTGFDLYTPASTPSFHPKVEVKNTTPIYPRLQLERKEEQEAAQNLSSSGQVNVFTSSTSDFWKKYQFLNWFGHKNGKPHPVSEQFPHRIQKIDTKRYRYALVGLGAFIFLVSGLAALAILQNATSKNQQVLSQNESSDSKTLAVVDRKGDVLAVTAGQPVLTINIQTLFNEDVTLDNKNLDIGTGELTASNVIYTLTAGENIAITAGQNPTISATFDGVDSLGGATGVITLGSNLSISNNVLNASTPSVNAFSTIDVNGTDIDAGAADTLTFSPGTGISLSADTGSKTITISASSTSNWTLSGTSLYPDSTTYNIGIGNTSPSYDLDVTGDINASSSFYVGGTQGATVGSYSCVTAVGGIITGSGVCQSGTEQWNFSNGTIAPINPSVDLLIGGSASVSAKFGLINVNSGTPAIQINGATVLTPTTLGTNVATSSLTAVGTLSSGAINTGFGIINTGNTITTTDTITGGTVNSTGALQTGGTDRISSGGNLQNIGTTQFNTITYTWPSGGQSAGYALVTDGSGTLSWSGTGGFGTNYWTLANALIYPTNISVDFAIGGSASTSAKFAVLNVNSGTPTASLSAGSAGGAYLTADGTLQTTANQALTIGGSTTGNITLSPLNGSGTVTSTGDLNLSSGKAYYINNASVLNATTLGSAVVNSSLTSTGALTSGSIASGFGTIATANTITGTTLNGTTGINTGAGAGTSRIDSSGNLANIGTISSTYLTTGASYVNLTSGTALNVNGTTVIDSSRNLANIGTTQFNTVTYSWPNSGALASNYVLVSDASDNLTWVDPGDLPAINYFEISNGLLYPDNSTLDFVIGGASTASAKFGFINVNSGTPAFQISGTTVLTGSALGSGVTSSSLTSVGALASGSIANGFGAIDSGNTITGTAINATSGINTGAGAGTQRIDSSGNLTNIGTTQFNTVTYTWPASATAGYVLTSGSSGATSTLSWTDASSLGSNYFSIGSGLLYPSNTTLDFAIGGSATTSAKFAVINIAGGTPTASLSAGAAGGAYLTAAGTLQTTANQALTIGGSTTGNITLSPLNGSGTTIFNGTTTLNGVAYTWPGSGGSNTYILQTNGSGVLSWVDPGTLPSSNYFTVANGAIYPYNPTLDLFIGAYSSASAKFGFVNVNSGTPAIQISGTTVLNGTTLGSGVVNSSLTSVGVLSSGSIASGFGTIATANTITGTTLNGTTGINTGAGAGTQRIDSSGNLTNIGTTQFNTITYTWPGSDAAGSGYALTSNGAGTLSWTASGGLGTNYWNLASGALYPFNSTVDLLIGGTSSASAKFGFINVNSGTPAIQISGTTVLTGSTLGSGVTSSSLTSTGALTSGSIASGFGTIATANTITGTTLNGTTGINTGAGAGTQRIDSSGNLTNIGTTQFNTITYTWPGSDAAGSGYALTSNGAGTLSWTATSGFGTNYWSIASGALYPTNTSLDFLLGASASSSAKFAVLNVAGGTPTASISANSGAYTTYLTGDGTLATTNRGDLNLGNSSSYNTTGNIFLNSNGTGNVGIGGTTVYSYAKLNVNGGVRANAYYVTDADGYRWGDSTTRIYGSSSGTSDYILFYVNGAESARFTANNYLGLKTTAPDKQLEINSSNGNNLRLTYNDSDGSAANYADFSTASDGGLTIDSTSTTTLSDNVIFGGTTTLNGVAYTWPATATANYVLTSGSSGATSTLSWTDPSSLGTNYWTIASGSIYPYNPTLDLFIGAYSSASAKFGFINVNSGTPAIQISGTTVLTGSTLGSGVTSSSLTSTGALTSGSIASGFGTIATANTITGTTLNGTTGINTGAGAGTQRIDSSGNLTNIGTTQFNTITYTWPGSDAAGSGYALTSNGAGTLSWTDTAGFGTNYWTIASGSIYPYNPSLDLLIGGTSTASADFAVLNVNGSSYATASVSGNLIVMPNTGLGGKVGIGTTNPTSELQINDTNGNSEAVINLVSTTGRIQLNGNNVLSANSGATTFSVNGSEKGRFTTTGLGVATTAPNKALEINSATGANLRLTYNDSDGSAANYADFSTASDGGLIIDSTSTTTLSDNVIFGGTTTLNGVTYTWPATATANYVLTSGSSGATSTLSWTDPSSLGTNYWTIASGSIYPYNPTLDLFIGAYSSASAKFGFINVNSGTPAIQISGTTVLTGSTLGSGVTASSLTSVGALTSGSIASGFGTIATANTITGTTLNGTTGINTGAGAGTARIDSSGNLTNIGTTQFNTITYTWPGADAGASGYALTSNGAGTLSWTDTSSFGASYFSVGTGTIYPTNTTLDFLLGASASSSAKFAFLGVASDTPIASISASSGSGLYLSYDGSIQTTKNAALTLGGSTTNGITIAEDVTTSTGVINSSVASGGTAFSFDADNSFTSGNLFSITENNGGTQHLTIDDAGNLNLNGTSTTAGFGNTIYGDTDAGAHLYLVSTSNGTKGNVYFQSTSNYINNSNNLTLGGDATFNGNNVGIGTSANSTSNLRFNSTSNIDVFSNVTAPTLTIENRGVGGNASVSIEGALTVGSTTTLNAVTYTWPAADAGASGYALTSNGAGTLSWTNLSSGTSYFTTGSGLLYPINATLDFAIGGTATTSAKFAVLNVAGGTPTASLSAGAAGGAYLTADGTLQTTAGQTLTLGGTTTGQINIGTDATARNITLGNSTGASSLSFTTGTGSQTFTSNVATGTTTTSGFVFDATAINSGTGAYFTSDSITTGKLVNIAPTGNTLTSGTLLNLSSTATSLTGTAGIGSLINLDWSPGSATTATGDLFALNIGTNGTTTGNLFNILDTGSSLFSVSETAVTSNLPVSFNSPGDVSIAYDLVFTNPTASYITSSAPLTIQAGEPFNSSNLTLGTYNVGNVVVDSQAFVTNYAATVSGQLVVGTATAPGNTSGLYVTNPSTYGKALAILNQTESQDLLTASSSGTWKFQVKNDGTVNLASGATYQIAGTNVLSASTLGSGVTSSSLTTVGALTSGSIASGFGTIATANTITGTTLNGTTGINTGAGAGTSRIDSSGNLANIGTISSTYLTTGASYVNLTSGTALNVNGTTVIDSSRNLANIGTTQINTVTYTWPAAATAGYILQSGSTGATSTLTWVDPGTLPGVWSLASGTTYLSNTTLDLLVGGTASASAKFAILGVSADTPVASISASSGSGLYLSYNGSIQTTKNANLTLGGATTGNIILSPLNNSGTVSIGTTSLISGAELQLSATTVDQYFLTNSASNTNLHFYESGIASMVLNYDGSGSGDANQIEFQDEAANPLLVIERGGHIGIGVDGPTAWLDIQAATTSEAQINLTSSAGTNPSAPVSGDLWWNGTNLYFYNGGSNVDLLGGSGITGSGTANRIAKFTASGTIGNSAITDDGTNISADALAGSAGATGTDGGNIAIAAGAGGSFSSANGGNGGGLTFTSGAGGSNSGSNGNGGAGGDILFAVGNGGRAGSSSSSYNGGAGGSFSINAGAGGPAPGKGGAGGNISLIAGSAGNSGSTGGGIGGSLTFTAGAGGNYSGANGGNGGGLTFTSGAGGSNSSTVGNGGAGGSVSYILGNGGRGGSSNTSYIAGVGGSFSVTAGSGGSAPGGVGHGGSVSFTTGNGGASTSSGNGGNAGNFNIYFGNGGTSSFGDGGSGGGINWQLGNGGNGDTGAGDVGGAGGSFIVTAGNNGTGNTVGVAGNIILTAGAGRGTTGGNVSIQSGNGSTDGTIDIGTNNSSAITIGMSGMTTSIGGNISVASFSTANTAGLCWDNSGASLIYDCNGAPTDLAEYFGATDSSVEAGDIVVADGNAVEVIVNGAPTSKAYVKKASASYQGDLLGVISTSPNQVYGDDGLFDGSENPRPVSLAGRVPVKVNTENGPINRGDVITSSSIPGVGMKATKAGKVLGVALSSYSGAGIGKVVMYVNPQYYLGDQLYADTASGFLDNSGVLKPEFDGKLLTADKIDQLIGEKVASGFSGIIPEINVQGIASLGVEGVSQGSLKISSVDSGSVTITSASSSANWTMTLPVDAGENGEVLVTDGNGNTSWVAPEVITSGLRQEVFGVLGTATDSAQMSTVFGKLAKIETEDITDINTKLSIFDVVTDPFGAISKAVFNVQIAFNNGVEFLQDIVLAGRIKHTDQDTAGIAVIKAGTTEVEIEFDRPYEVTPIVNLTANNNAASGFVKNATESGFTVAVEATPSADVQFTWSAVLIENPRISESGVTPTPTATPSPTLTPTPTP